MSAVDAPSFTGRLPLVLSINPVMGFTQ